MVKRNLILFLFCCAEVALAQAPPSGGTITAASMIAAGALIREATRIWLREDGMVPERMPA